MNASPEKIRTLGPLLLNGQFHAFHKLMLEIWKPNDSWNEEDVRLITTILIGAYNIDKNNTRPVYETYRKRIRSHRDDYAWLLTLMIRYDAVWTWEGTDSTILWLEETRNQIEYYPNQGIVDLLIGHIFMSENNFVLAREYLRKAVETSVLGIEWYRLEALNLMGNCLVRLKDYRLAFEYARTTCMESYKLGRYDESSLFKAVYGISLIYGQIDYVIEVKKNLATSNRMNNRHSNAALDESDVGFRLAQINMRDEAAESLYLAANDAKKGVHLGDPNFGFTCILLGRYLETKKLALTEIISLFESCDLTNQVSKQLITDIVINFKNSENLNSGNINKYTSIIRLYNNHRELSSSESSQLLIVIHLFSLLARFYLENKNIPLSFSFYEMITSIKSNDAIFVFTREDYVQNLINNLDYSRAIKLCEIALSESALMPLERFVFRQLISTCYLSLGNLKQAYQYALKALSDWKRILIGQYDEVHKINWLAKGKACLLNAIEAIKEPVDWMQEHKRKEELFRLIEMGKARLLTDMICYETNLPGIYAISKVKRDISLESFFFNTKYPDFYVPLVLQLAVFADEISTITHNYDLTNYQIKPRNINALRGVINLPVSAETLLYANADSLYFEEPVDNTENELYDDLIKMTSAYNNK